MSKMKDTNESQAAALFLSLLCVASLYRECTYLHNSDIGRDREYRGKVVCIRH
jgi:hypothetical protein